jgi:hypothetical protein
MCALNIARFRETCPHRCGTRDRWCRHCGRRALDSRGRARQPSLNHGCWSPLLSGAVSRRDGDALGRRPRRHDDVARGARMGKHSSSTSMRTRPAGPWQDDRCTRKPVARVRQNWFARSGHQWSYAIRVLQKRPTRCWQDSALPASPSHSRIGLCRTRGGAFEAWGPSRASPLILNADDGENSLPNGRRVRLARPRDRASRTLWPTTPGRSPRHSRPRSSRR